MSRLPFAPSPSTLSRWTAGACAVAAVLTLSACKDPRDTPQLPAYIEADMTAVASPVAGILFKIGSEIFVAAQHRTALVLGMFVTYLVVKRLSPRYAVLAALLIGTALGTSMPPYRQLLTSDEIWAVTAYIQENIPFVSRIR